MSKKILLLSLSLSGLLFFAATGRAIPFSTESTNLTGEIRSQVELAKSNIVRGKDSAAQTAIDKLLTDFSDNEHIAEAVCKIADQYYQLRKYQKADKLYQHIIDNWSDAEHTMWARMHLILSYVTDDKQLQAQADCGKLLANFSGNEHMTNVICQIADSYRKSGEYEKALELYQHIINNWPETEHAMWAQMHITLSHIAKGEQTQAKAAYRKLVADFSHHKFVVNAVMQIVENYCNSGRANQACEFFQDAIDNEPQAEHMIWSQMGLAVSNIALGDDTATQASVDKLLADFSGNKHIVNAFCHVADSYRKLEKHEKAHELYKYIVENWPEAEYAMWAQMHLAIYISSGDQLSAQAAYEKLIANYSEHEEIAYALYQVANSYHESGRYGEAIKLYQYALDNWPGSESEMWLQMGVVVSNIALRDDTAAQAAADKLISSFSGSEHIADSVYQLADSYRESGKYEKAREVYQYLADNQPDYEYAWNAQFLISYCYERLGNSGAVSESIAESETRAAYEQLLEKYPACKAARHARRWLSHHSSE